MDNLLDFVMGELRTRDKPLAVIAQESGVPYFTLQKWVRSEGTRNPRVASVQKLANYFRDNSHRAA
jgi:hypothetical protein